MPWSPRDTMSLRHEFVLLAQQPGCNRRELCRRFQISPQTGYKWLARHVAEGEQGLADRSRRPRASPAQTDPSIEQAVVALRRQHPAWGGRKISRRLHDLGMLEVPAPSTVTSILHRHGLVTPQASAAAMPWQRFEHAAPNDLWQMDFKGYFTTRDGKSCSPLTVLDDHSRFNVVLRACHSTRSEVVQQHLREAFARYGLPWRINTDNGSPWGSPVQPGQLTGLAIWLIRLGVRLSYSQPAHPQTNGKDERFHRTLKAEVLAGHTFATCRHVQQVLNAWRTVYNQQRPHQALGMATPITRYRPSQRSLPRRLPPLVYGPDDTVVTVGWHGELRFAGRRWRVSNALDHLPIALRPDPRRDGCYDLYFAHHRFGYLDLNSTTRA